MAEPLLSSEFLRKLERLELTTRKVLAGRLKGERRSKRRGTSVEFADHRQYSVGDDLRFIDWNIYVRLDRLFIKLFEEEEDLRLHVLIDVSGSMTFGDPSKLDYARRVAAALGFIGLVHLDRVMIHPFACDLGRSMPAARGRGSVFRMLDFLGELGPAAAPEDGSDFSRSMRTFALRHSGKGVVVVLSDLLDKAGFETGLRYLIARQMDVHVVHILAREEVEPDLAGDLELIDVEDGERAEVTVSAPLLARYRRNLEAFRAAAQEFTTRRGISYLFTTNHLPFERLVLRYLRDRGVLR